MPERLDILLIEDNPADCALLRSELAAHPEVTLNAVGSLKEAMPLIDVAAPDVVLLDLDLPDARGLTAVEWLQRQHPTIPVVVLSGFAGDDLTLASETVREGAQDYLGKGHIEAEAMLRRLHLARTRKAREVHQLRWARHDPLTGLPWPVVLEEAYHASVARARRSRRTLALLRIEMDGYAALRVEHGGDRADQALVCLAQRVGYHMRKTDILTRVESPGFLALVDTLKSPVDSYVVARKILALARQPFDLEGLQIPLKVSIGIVAHGHGDLPLATLIERADDAVRTAQHAGGDCYEAVMEEEAPAAPERISAA